METSTEFSGRDVASLRIDRAEASKGAVAQFLFAICKSANVCSELLTSGCEHHEAFGQADMRNIDLINKSRSVVPRRAH
jgi:hypothetical protein